MPEFIQYQDAIEVTKSIKKVCLDPVCVVMKSTSDLEPAADADAVIVCGMKSLDITAPNDMVFCRVMNDSACPRNISVETLQTLRTEALD